VTPAVASVVVGALLGTAASAETPWLISKKPIAKLSSEEAVYLFMGCSIRRSPGPEKLLAWSRFAAEDPRAGEALRSVITSECMPVDYSGNIYSLKFKSRSARGGLFEALYNSKFHTTAPPKLSDVASPDFASEFSETPRDQSLESIAIRDFGDCVAMAQTALSHRFLETDIGSHEEEAALTAIAPSLGSCLPTGSQYKFDRPAFRGLLAEAMYKRAADMVHAAPNVGKP